MLQRFSNDKAGLLAVVLVSSAFVLIRLLMPIKFDGSYIDEYWHITSGISLFGSGEYPVFYNDGKAYTRGLLMSLWVGSWVTLFGKSILVAKLAPISIAIINYFLFLYLTIKLIEKRRFQLLLLLLYTLSPWIIFNHFYIRFYIVNELLLLILLVLGYQLYNAIRDEKWASASLFLSLVILLNIFSQMAIRDQSEYMLLFASCVMFAVLFIYEFNTEPKTSYRLFSVISGNILLSNKIYRILILLAIAAIGLIVLDAGSKIDFLLHGTIVHTSMPGYKYTWLFWEKNGVITAFFVLAVATFWWKSRGFERIVLPVAGMLFVIHIASSEDLQIVRGVLYFLPVYYFVAVIGVSKVFTISKLRGPSEWLWYVIISSIFLFVTVTNVPKYFYYGPNIPFEIHYIEYERLYDSVSENCRGNLIVEAAPSSPFIARFHDVNVDYVLSAAGNAGKNDQNLIDADTGKISTAWEAVPVITDINDLKLLDKDICLVVRSVSKKLFLPATIEDMLKSAEKSWHFHKMDLYILEQKTLMGGSK